MLFDWNAMEAAGGTDMMNELAKGGTGKMHRLYLADMALQKAMEAQKAGRAGVGGMLLETGRSLICAAWDADPLDGGTAAQLLALDDMQPFLPDSVRSVAQHMRQGWSVPQDQRYYQRLLQKRDTALTMGFLEKQTAREPDNAYWLQQRLALAGYEGDTGRVEAVIAGATSLPLPVRTRLLADMHLMRGDAEQAAALYESVWPHSAGMTEHLTRAAEALTRCGREDTALRLWQTAFALRGWDSNLLLRLSDVADGTHTACRMPEGRGAVLLYSYNKAACLDITLGSLAASRLDDARIIVLDNGSSDATPGVLARWKEHLGDGLLTVTLPCNVGAPAARNWLMHLTELDGCRWVAYCDDDVELPADWLGRMGAAMQRYPHAAAWGCRVVDHANPALIQSVDMHLDAPQPQSAEQVAAEGERRFAVSMLQHQDMDFGQFTYMRPCATVTGCCHLFLLDALRSGGGFDLRYSPSQYDDLEHDLRQVLQGRLPVYQGHLAVRHMKRSGKAALQQPEAQGNASANMYKLQMRYTKDEFETMRRHDYAALKQDLLRKAAALAASVA
ncbi:glycosyl transferase family 2 [Oleidesulfovibrio alaskensis G20]|uniref:Glycosyl transferase family 2 n=1 Tax=Oleidesulfovibrio alaskensis (strain ATCC BAA-1058 / DSM 17464 / G20) TaxID=207559 RepID=Q311W0_OLEA2|nr:glycosyltransferase family 2 protein [Oleidesulfovibrio alaskensis]ABB38286.2 glycosyl transferase family 2 [Oleidesulfovibrio alaskensis G20]MBG0774236.1 glycosyltransferase family 2 protein [Oleidesulfovibrio alaskensis]